MPKGLASLAALAGWAISAMVLSSTSALVAAGTLDMELVCLKSQTKATRTRLMLSDAGDEIAP